MTSVTCHHDNRPSIIIDQDWQICSYIGQIDLINQQSPINSHRMGIVPEWLLYQPIGF